MKRVILSMILAASVLLARDGASADAALDQAASKAVIEFMDALRQQDLDTAMHYVGIPFVAEATVLDSEEDVRAYFAAILGEADPAQMPNQVLGVASYEAHRARANEPTQQLHDQVLGAGDVVVGMAHDGTPRGYWLMKANGGKPLVVGVGY
ncbi:MAG: hypothetical protein R3D05_05590 [Dongiaceae bacterium]